MIQTGTPLALAPLLSFSPFKKQLLNIEEQAQLTPWSALMFESSFKTGDKVVGAFLNQQLVGFSVTQILLDELNLLNIAVHPAYQGQGIGNALLKALCLAAGKHPIFLEVRTSNKNAIQLYQKYGFKEVGLRKNYYALPQSQAREDAFVYCRQLEC